MVNGINSDSIPVSSGVPQGSVLGPILFLAYINDIQDQVNSRVRLFVDDTAMYLAITSLSESDIIQQDLTNLGQREKLWDMNFNLSKCRSFMLKTSIPTKYLLHGIELESVLSAKYLGVTI